ncbi:MAG: hypothetical protein HUJ91_02960 [Bacteroidales bacterium]|nr:hypothetical protein [Bacteroidales bacterium]
MAVSAILLVVFFVMPHSTANEPIVNTYLIWTYILLFASIACVLVFLLIGVCSSAKSLLKFVGLIVAAVAIVAVSYLLAPGGEIATSVDYTATTSKLADTGLFVTYFMLAASIVALFVTAIWNAIKNR